MKVKNNNKLLIFLIIFLTLFGLILVFFNPIEKLVNQFSNLKKIVTVGFQGNIVSEDALSNYYSKNQKFIDVKHYNIRLNLFPDKKLLKGNVIISGVVVDSAISSLDLNFYDNMKVSSVMLNSNNIMFNQHEKTISIEKHLSKNDTFLVSIIYEGTPQSLGFGSFEFGEFDKKSVVYSLSEPIYASTWFPCNDKPTDKATADIFITNDSSKVSVSNGKLISVKTKGKRRTYHWKTEYPISTYLICFYSADYSEFEESYTTKNGEQMPIKFYAFPKHLKNAKNDFAINLPALKFFANKFGEYPFVKEKYGVAEFLWNMGAMEHQTITGIGERLVSGKGFFKDIYVHELAHQWWGDAVSPKTWKDVWLNEGFATYSEALFWEYQSGYDALSSTMTSKFGEFDNGTLYNPGTALFSKLIYNKGSWVLHMLRKEVGDKNFNLILKCYFKKYEYHNASTLDFKKLCEKISNRNLDYFFNQWVFKGTGIIHLNYKIENKIDSNGKSQSILKLLQTQKGFSTYHFPLDVRFDFDGQPFVDSTFNIYSRDTLIVCKFNYPVKNIELDRKNWLLAKNKRTEKLKE